MGNIKLSLRLVLVLVLFNVGFIACLKPKVVYTLRITADDANTARVWRDTVGKTTTITIDNGNGSKVTGRSWSKSMVKGGNSDLISAVDSNVNDARILAISISYKKNAVKKVEYKLPNSLAVGQEFTKLLQMRQGTVISVTAKAEQTGESKALNDFREILSKGSAAEDASKIQAQVNSWINEDKNGAFADKRTEALLMLSNKIQNSDKAVQRYQNELVGRRAEDAKLTLTVEILRNGAVVSSQKIQSVFAVDVDTKISEKSGKK